MRTQLRDFYRQPAWRVKRFGVHVDTRRHEDLMARQLRETYGPPEEVFIGIGHWLEGRGGLHWRGKEPAIGIGWHRMLRRHGYETVWMGEAYTPRQCSRPGCCGHIEYNWFSTAPLGYQGPGRGMRRRRLSKLPCCTSCGMVWQRDVNAACNMYTRTLAALEAAQAPQAGGAP
jgi:hypothetical protein